MPTPYYISFDCRLDFLTIITFLPCTCIYHTDYLIILLKRYIFILKWQFCKSEICSEYSNFVLVNTSRSFPHSWLITGFVIRLTRRVSLVEQELPTLPEHLSSPRFLVEFVFLDLYFYMYVLYIVVCPWNTIELTCETNISSLWRP
jgi:hypothetical protein